MIGTLFILISIASISAYAFNNQRILDQLAFKPYAVEKYNQFYRFASHILVHADFSHLLFNGLVAFFFLPEIESIFVFNLGTTGSFVLVIYFLLGGILASIPSYLRNNHNPNYVSLGASGAVSTILFTSITLNPLSPIYLYGVIGLPGVVWGVIYLAYSYYQDKNDFRSNIDHQTHLWGSVVGIIGGLLMILFL